MIHLFCQRGDIAKLRDSAFTNDELDKKDDNGWTPLLIAIEMNYFEIVKLLVDRGANLEVASLGGFTPFLLAVDSLLDTKEENSELDFRVIDFLLQKGVDITATNDTGHSVFDIIKQYGGCEALESRL